MGLDEQTRRRLLAFDVIVSVERGEGAPTLRALALIDAAPEQVWRLIDDSGSYAETMVGVKASKELAREGDVVRTQVTVGMPFPLKNLMSITEAVHSVEPGVRYVRRWKLIGGDYRQNQGNWTLTPFEGDAGRTLVSYEIQVEPAIRIPGAVAGAVQKRAIPKLIAKLRERCRA